jgi:hypothetical protein
MRAALVDLVEAMPAQVGILIPNEYYTPAPGALKVMTYVTHSNLYCTVNASISMTSQRADEDPLRSEPPRLREAEK